MRKVWGHWRTIRKHRRLVRALCFRCGYYRQGLLHDLSKYAPIEFWRGVRYFEEGRSPHFNARIQNGYSAAWLHHKGRNRHHWEYWTELEAGECIPIRMPIRYVVEMWCDRIAATKVYKGDAYRQESALRYFQDHYDDVMMHPQTKALIELLLKDSAVYGEAHCIALIRNEVKSKGYALLEEV